MIDFYSYNSHGELLSSKTVRGSNDAVYNSYSLTRDNGGRILTKTENNLGVETSHNFGYDLAGRLASVVRNGIATTYSYDENGNRLSRNRNSNVTAYTYNAQDQLLSAGIFTYSYNENGERITKTNSATGQTIRYRYDSFGNLLGADLPNGTSIDYVLDALHRRVGKKVNGQIREVFVYQDALRLAGRATFSSSDVMARAQLFLYPNKSNVPEAMYDHVTGTYYRVIADERGTPRTILDNISGAAIQTITTDEFGMVQADTNPGFFPFKLAGCLYDEDTRLCHFGAREYDPEVGKWLQRDPINFAGRDSNLYGYSLQDPINFLDLDGLTVTFKDNDPSLKALYESLKSNPNLSETDRAIIAGVESKGFNVVIGSGTEAQRKAVNSARKLPADFTTNAQTVGCKNGATITLFDANEATSAGLQAILLHELAHAQQHRMGLPMDEKSAYKMENNFRRANGVSPVTPFP